MNTREKSTGTKAGHPWSLAHQAPWAGEGKAGINTDLSEGGGRIVNELLLGA